MDTIARIPELVHEIVSYLDSKSDLSNARLLNGVFAHEALSYLFREIRVKASEPSLSRLIEISFTPHLAPLVRGVCLVTSSYISELLWLDFQEALTRELQHIEDEHQRRKSPERVFLKILNEWLEFGQSSDYPVMLSTAFTNLPNLEALSIRQVYRPPGFDKELCDCFEKPSEYYKKSSVTRAFEALSKAAFHSRRKIKYFHVTDIDPEAAIHEPLTYTGQAGSRDETLSARIPPFFRNCRGIKLAFSMNPRGASYQYRESWNFWNNMHNIIAEATDLRDLAISFDESSLRLPIAFSRVLRTDHLWRVLGSLELCVVSMEWAEISKFLLLHKMTLRKITFSHCEIFLGYWDNLVIFIRENLMVESLDLYPNLVDDINIYSDAESCNMLVRRFLEGNLGLRI